MSRSRATGADSIVEKSYRRHRFVICGHYALQQFPGKTEVWRMRRVFAISVGLMGLGVGLGASLAAVPAAAQTIYPLNRAEILAGSRFDLKVEFPGAPAQGAVTVTINGEDAAKTTGKPAGFIEKEDGG